MKRMWINVSGTWKRVRHAYIKVAGAWKAITLFYVKSSNVWRAVPPGIVLTIPSNTSNYNAFTAAGSPSGAQYVTVFVDFGVIVNSTSTGTPAFDTGAFDAGTTFRLINSGQIIGAGGDGGNGGSIDGDLVRIPAEDGGVGGESINTQVDLTIDNTDGDIFGGGGGGGGGGSGAEIATTAGGGGGGGGAGDTGGALGVRGTHSPLFSGCDGVNGTAGTSVAGNGGAGCSHLTAISGAGGNGGEYGTNGSNGVDGNDSVFDSDPGLAGSAGKAVDLNGNSITWLGGNNGTQVKGAVS